MSKKEYNGSRNIGDTRQHKSDGSGTKIKMQLSPYKVVILHPSMCCPELIHPDDVAKPMRLIVGTDKRFFDVYQKEFSGGEPDKSNWRFRQGISRTIARFLKIQKWETGQTKNKDALSVKDTLLGEITNEPMSTDTLRNIACTFLGKIEEKITRTSGKGKKSIAFIRDEKEAEELFALINPQTLTYLKSLDVTYIFEIQLHGIKLEPNSLYEISWMIYNKDFSIANNKYTEWQDYYTNHYIKKDKHIHEDLQFAFKIGDDLDFKPEESIPIQNHHFFWVAPAGKDRLDVGHLTDVHVSSRHHIFRKSNAQLIPNTSEKIGPMVHRSFDALKDLMDQYGKGNNAVDLLIFTGDLIDYGRNYNPLAYTGNKSGDIWDEMILDKLNLRDEKTNKVILDKKGNIQADTKRYPRSIDHVTIYSLFYYYYKTYGKPIILISGNHEAYTVPYGISPRALKARGIYNSIVPKFDKKKFKDASTVLPTGVRAALAIGGQRSDEEMAEETMGERQKDWSKTQKKENPDIYAARANEGIPADHNLTIGEATLMYGPDYARVVAGGGSSTGGRVNFRSKNLDWFYTVFTPFSDFILEYKDQSFLGLEWGEEENFSGSILDGQVDLSWKTTKLLFMDGILPRANKSLNKNQIALVKQSLSKKHPCKMLLTHFTLVSYNYHLPINKRGFVLHGKDGYPTHHDVGTFEKNRDVLYKPFRKGQFQYALAGHSHRAALYGVDDAPWYKDTYDFLYSLITAETTTRVKGEAVRHNGTTVAKYSGKMLKSIKTRTLVSACGGPIAVQNYNEELANNGLDYPSGSIIKFNGSKEDRVGVVRTTDTVTTAQPRLAVALDYAEITKEKSVFTEFTATDGAGPFSVKVNPKLKLPVTDIIESAKIVLFVGKKPTSIALTRSSQSPDTMILSLKSDDSNKLRDVLRNTKNYTCFIEIKLSNKVLKGDFAHYDVKKPWTYQIEINTNTRIKCNAHGQACRTVSAPGYKIKRHSVWGEIANHQWYSKTIGGDYVFPWGKYGFSNKEATYPE